MKMRHIKKRTKKKLKEQTHFYRQEEIEENKDTNFEYQLLIISR